MSFTSKRCTYLLLIFLFEIIASFAVLFGIVSAMHQHTPFKLPAKRLELLHQEENLRPTINVVRTRLRSLADSRF